ncbi:MAG TPA: (2Fe-2S)-binding protein [Steroidobacteraceae bacterium]
METYTLFLDGRRIRIECPPDMPLLYALRGDLRLKGPKFGCGLAQCGACTVLVEGSAVRSCVIPMASIKNKKIRSLDGLGTPSEPHPVQRAFLEEQAALCGYCTNGWIMTAVAALEKQPRVSDADIRAMLTGLKCRCGAHMAMLRAIRRAADEMAGQS